MESPQHSSSDGGLVRKRDAGGLLTLPSFSPIFISLYSIMTVPVSGLLYQDAFILTVFVNSANKITRDRLLFHWSLKS